MLMGSFKIPSQKFSGETFSSSCSSVIICSSKSDLKVGSIGAELSFSAFRFDFPGAVKRQKRVAVHSFNIVVPAPFCLPHPHLSVFLLLNTCVHVCVHTRTHHVLCSTAERSRPMMKNHRQTAPWAHGSIGIWGPRYWDRLPPNTGVPAGPSAEPEPSTDKELSSF